MVKGKSQLLRFFPHSSLFYHSVSVCAIAHVLLASSTAYEEAVLAKIREVIRQKCESESNGSHIPAQPYVSSISFVIRPLGISANFSPPSGLNSLPYPPVRSSEHLLLNHNRKNSTSNAMDPPFGRQQWS